MVGDDDILYLSVIRYLLENKVEFILLGGMAVNYHGVKRFTNDMDLWINPTKENFEKVLRALVDLGYEEEEINNIKKYRNIDSPTPIKLFDDRSLYRVDLMTQSYQTQFSWEECYKHANLINFRGHQIPVININHLIEMKKNIKRYDRTWKDISDANELLKIKEKLNKEKNKGKGKK